MTPMKLNEHGLLVTEDHEVCADSRAVAEVLNKTHKEVLDAIDEFGNDEFGFSTEFSESAFKPVKYMDNGKMCRCYLVTQDGFCLLFRIFYGSKPNKVFDEYIKRYNEMEDWIAEEECAADMIEPLIDSIQNAYENPTAQNYIDEMNIITKSALGMPYHEYRKSHDLSRSDSITEAMDEDDEELFFYLEIVDTGLLLTVSDIQQRKHLLEWAALNWEKRHIPVSIGLESDDADED